MGVVLQFEIEGAKEVAVELGIAAEGINDWRQPLQRISGELLKSFDMNFASRGALFGGWASRKQPRPWPLMEKSGNLRHSFRGDVSSDSVTLLNTAPYFKYHQSSAPRQKLPRRVMMKIDETRRNFVIKAFQAHIIDKTQGLR